MRVGISLLTLVPGVVGGTETYARELLRALEKQREHEYRVFLPTIAPDPAGSLPATTVTAYRAGRSMPARMLAMTEAIVRPRPIRAQLELPSLDVLHFPLSAMLPRVSLPPAVTTVHDLFHENYRGAVSRAEHAYRRVVYGWTIRRSRLLICPSEYVRGELERAGADPDRVRVIHHGIDHDRFRPDPAKTREPFLIYPAKRWPHKNHDRLLDAFTLLRRERPELRLVLTGADHDGTAAPAGVEIRGYINRGELIDLLQRASALVFPSLYEGFGTPPIEAMACGCPAAVSRARSLPEVCGDAAVYFDPTDVEDIARGIAQVLDEQEEWARRGLEHARRYTWEAAARRHNEVYAEAAAG